MAAEPRRRLYVLCEISASSALKHSISLIPVQWQLHTALPPLQVAEQLCDEGQDLVQLPSGPLPQVVAQLLSTGVSGKCAGACSRSSSIAIRSAVRRGAAD